MDGALTILLLLKRVDCNDGVASYCQTVIEGLHARGHRVVILSGPVTSSPVSQWRRDAIEQRVDAWQQIEGIGRAARFPKAAWALREMVRSYGVDVISPQGLSMLPLATTVGRLTGTPVVANRHLTMSGWESSASNGLRARALRRTFSTLFRAERYIAISQEIREGYRASFRVPDADIAVIPNGVDTEFFHPPSPEEKSAARAAFGIPEGNLVCTLIGRLDPVKGHDVLVDAARALRSRRPELRITYLFGGSGDGEEGIRAYAHRDAADAEAFRFLGFLSGAQTRAAYHATDILVLPSRREGFPIVVVEGMASGCVPVRTRISGAQEQILEGETGFLIEVDDAEALAARIGDLADEARRAHMSAAAVRHVARAFSRRAMIEQTCALYSAVARTG